MRKALFLIFHGVDPNNGISKKISYQVNALRTCGMDVHLCYMDEIITKRRFVDDTCIADYGSGLKSKILKRIESMFSKLANFSYTLYLTHRITLLFIFSFFFEKYKADISMISRINFIGILFVCLIVAFILYYCVERHTGKVKMVIRSICNNKLIGNG